MKFHNFLASFVLLFALISLGTCSAPEIPETLKQKLTSQGENLPYYIFLKIWTTLSLDKDREACSIVIPADSSFEMFVSSLKKEDVQVSLDSGAVESIIMKATSPFPFERQHDTSGAKGKAALKGATFRKPAFALTFTGKKIFVWESRGKTLANGAEVLLQESAGDDCVLIVTQSFPFARPHDFFSYIQKQLGIIGDKAYVKVN